MNKKDLTKIALMGVASGLVFSGQISAEPVDFTNKGQTQIARGGCGSKCGGHQRSTRRTQRYNPRHQESGESCNGNAGCGGENMNQNGNGEDVNNCNAMSHCNGANHCEAKSHCDANYHGNGTHNNHMKNSEGSCQNSNGCGGM